MKLKARDIIPGWPRGSSSSRPIYNPTGFHEDCWPKNFREFVSMSIVIYLEMEADAEYRENQNHMVDEWRRNHVGLEESARVRGSFGEEIVSDAILFRLWAKLQDCKYKAEEEALNMALHGVGISGPSDINF